MDIRDEKFILDHHNSPGSFQFPTLVTNLFIAGIACPALGVAAVVKRVLWLVYICAVIACIAIAGVACPTFSVAAVMKRVLWLVDVYAVIARIPIAGIACPALGVATVRK